MLESIQVHVLLNLDKEWQVDHQESANSLTQQEGVDMETDVVLYMMSTRNHHVDFLGESSNDICWG